GGSRRPRAQPGGRPRGAAPLRGAGNPFPGLPPRLTPVDAEGTEAGGAGAGRGPPRAARTLDAGVSRGHGRSGKRSGASAGARGRGRGGGGRDTCHLFAAGYDLSSETGTEAVMDEAVRRFGSRRIRCFHLNDSLRPRGSRVDRHANIGRGEIGLPAFRYLVNDKRFRVTPAVLETPDSGRYARGLRLLHSLIRK